MSKIILSENATTPTTPSPGKRLIYPKSDGWYEKNDAGTEAKISGATTLNGLTDVVIGTPEKGDLLFYDHDDAGKWKPYKSTATIFGCSASFVTSQVSDSNGSSTYETYLTLENVPCVANKKFRIGAGLFYGLSSTSVDFQAILTYQEDGGTETTLGEIAIEPKEAGTDNTVPLYCPFIFTPTTSNNYTYRMKYRSESGAATAYVSYGILEAWRVEL